ncbi:GlsB/YeaQ/YmgE family stress response membrane protein [Paracoccus onubensis]|uniref:GlsB/YeaQ/YmgE family stress response membrane protein n=1 Tax=Paracoccus onubensis TaxID=1675788 RepID=A0A418SLN7_9RHOB|nr:GlsB/YeaQ/YmgE family stress response membrane protein [Paracoccus onubensis]RJE81849.1 GlsB/YeaQ/YmgE family stress response membrane protein [Paracoccus onubensis]
MSGVGWFMAIILGGIAGWIAEKVMKAEHGLLTNIILGIVGALLGNWLARLIFGTTAGGWIGQLVIAVIGACILIWGYRAIRSRG